jgi:hypothetical protein
MPDLASCVVDYLKRQNQELTAYFNSLEFKEKMRIIKRHDFISQIDLMYERKKIKGLSHEHLSRVGNAVFHNLKSEVKKVNDFEYCLDYQGVKFTIVLGQGSVYFTQKSDH